MRPNNDSHLISYLTLRKLLGALGILLPVILIAGTFIHPDLDSIQSSISQFYHTGLRDVFVVVLASFGLFLFTYKGYEAVDNWLTNLAGICALFVAFFPTSIGDCLVVSCKIHFISAGLFLLLLAIISFFLFTKSKYSPASRTPRKRIRNRIYRICAVLILFCVILLFLYFQFAEESAFPRTTVFWLETFALWAFGFSWLVKGEALLGDN